MELLDCNFFVGHPTVADYQCYATVCELLDAASLAGITGGIVWHVAQRDYSPDEGNRLLARAITDVHDVFGCWTLLPPQTGEVITGDFFEQMNRCRVRALRAFPDRHRFQLRKSVFGKLFDELAARKVPLVLSLDGGVTWPVVYDLLEDVPNLTCILCDIGIWGVDRQSWPLLQRYPNVYIETSLLSLSEYGLEKMTRKFGAERLLFGTGFPARYAEAAVLQLLHAEISDDDKASIGAANLRRVLSEMVL